MSTTFEMRLAYFVGQQHRHIIVCKTTAPVGLLDIVRCDIRARFLVRQKLFAGDARLDFGN